MNLGRRFNASVARERNPLVAERRLNSEDSTQLSLRDWKIEISAFPAFKRLARLKSRSAAGESNLKISDKGESRKS